MKKEEKQLKEFEKLHKQFLDEVVKPYDSNNKGSYFVYDREANESEGITYDRGGCELVELGSDLIANVITLYAPRFREINKNVHQIMENAHPLAREGLRELAGDSYDLVWRVKQVEDDKIKHDGLYKDIFTDVSNLTNRSDISEIPYNYKEGLGEMVFHQIRIGEHSGGGIDFNWTRRALDDIFKSMHVGFLEDRKSEFGEALVKELLSKQDAFWKFYQGEQLPARQAQDVIKRYGVTDENLIATVDKSLVLEANHYAELESLKRQRNSAKNSFAQQRREILARVGISEHYFD